MPILNLLIVALSFWLATAGFLAVETGWSWDAFTWMLPVSVLSFWLCTEYRRSESLPGMIGESLSMFCIGTGGTLIVNALVTYVLSLSPAPYLIAIPAGLAAAMAQTALNRALHHQHEHRAMSALVLTDEEFPPELIAESRMPLIGTVGNSAAGNLKRLGSPDELEALVAQLHPTHVIVASDLVPNIVLMDLQARGVVIVDIAAYYEDLLRRVSCRHLKPADLILNPMLRADRRAMAVQAIYNNLVGLALLVLLSPVLLVVSILVRLFSHRGPVFETSDREGFQKVPFRMIRFQTRGIDGSYTAIGKLLFRLHLVNIPQIINIVRGEMALFGPRPIRPEMAERLTRWIPFYTHRFSAKPGILGWSQMHLRTQDVRAHDLLSLEYDLYYIKNGSPLVDMEIFVSTVASFLLGLVKRQRKHDLPETQS